MLKHEDNEAMYPRMVVIIKKYFYFKMALIKNKRKKQREQIFSYLLIIFNVHY